MDCEQLQQAYQNAQYFVQMCQQIRDLAQTSLQQMQQAAEQAQANLDNAQLTLTSLGGQAEAMQCDWYTGGGGA